MPDDDLNLDAGLVAPPSPRDKVHGIAASSGIAPEIADDYLKVTGGIESGNSHYDSRGKVRRSIQGAIGFGQLTPDQKGRTTKMVGGRTYDLMDENQNMEAGLRYFAQGGDDPVRRRIGYFGGQKSAAISYYDRTGQIPRGQDKLGTSYAKYVAVTGGQKQKPDPLNLDAGVVQQSDSQNLDSGLVDAPATVKPLPQPKRQSRPAGVLGPVAAGVQGIKPPPSRQTSLGPMTAAASATRVVPTTQPGQVAIDQLPGVEQPSPPPAAKPSIWETGLATLLGKDVNVPDDSYRVQPGPAADPERMLQAQSQARVEQEQATAPLASLPSGGFPSPLAADDKATKLVDAQHDYQRRLTTNAAAVAASKARWQKVIQDQGGWTPGIDKWLAESLTSSTAHIASQLAGGAKAIGLGSEGAMFNSRWADAEGMRQAVEEESRGRSGVSKTGQSVLSGLMSPEIFATAVGVPAPAAFGIGSALETAGTGGNLGDVAQSGGIGAGTGYLFGAPGAGESRVAQALSKGGVVGAGTYALTGDPAAAGTNALFAASGARRPEGATETPTIESRAIAPTEPAVESAARSAFDRVGVSPEAAEKATRSQSTALSEDQPIREQRRAILSEKAAIRGGVQEDALSSEQRAQLESLIRKFNESAHHSAFQPRTPAGEFDGPPNEQWQPTSVLEGNPDATLTNEGRTFNRRAGDWYMQGKNGEIKVTNAATRAELNRQAGKFGGEEGFAGERKPTTPQYGKSGAVDDIQELGDIDTQPASTASAEANRRRSFGQFMDETEAERTAQYDKLVDQNYADLTEKIKRAKQPKPADEPGDVQDLGDIDTKWRGQEGAVGERPEPTPQYGRSGAVADLPKKTDTKYDFRVKPANGVADISEVAKAATPLYDSIRAEAARQIADGKLDPAKFTTYVRQAMNSRIATEGWHKTNEQAAYKLVTDLAKRERYDPASRSFRTTLPITSKFVDDKPLNFRIDSTDRTTARDLRREYSSAKNAQIVLGNNLAKQLKAEVKDKLGREGIYFNIAVGGDKTALQSYLDNPNPLLDPYRPAIERALALKPWEQKWANALRQGYDELGDYSRALGTIRNVKEDYHNRIYVQEKAGKDFVQSETFRKGLGQYTGHSKPQVYANVLDAVLGKLPDGNKGNPKKLAITEADQAYSILNEEMARVNTNAKFREAMSAAGLGSEVAAGSIPSGYKALPGMGREIPVGTDERLTYKRGRGWGYTQPAEEGATILRREFVVPEGIAKGLKAVTNVEQLPPVLQRINEVQGRIKTLDLAFSAFHHLAMLHTLIAQTKGGIDVLTHLPQMRKWAASGELDAAEQDFVRHTGMTTRVESNADVMRGLIQGDDVLSRATRIPVVKQVLQGAEKSSDFLFDNIQRKMKVIDYANKAAAWLGDHPDATERQIVDAKRSIASEINAAYGGLNWTALGISKSTLGLLRLVLLAPDWTVSNFILPAKIAMGGPGAKAAASHLITSAIASTIATAGLNHLMHGKDNKETLALLKAGKYSEAGAAFTGQRELGHELEVEVAPGVYIPMFRGGISDIVKLYGLVHELGPARGTLQFTSNKLAPFPRAIVGAISNTAMGRPILVPYNPSESWLRNTVAQLKQTGQLIRPALPIPLGVSQAVSILSRKEKPSLLGLATALSGAGRVTSNRGPRTEAEKYMYRLSQLQGKTIYEPGTDAEVRYQVKSGLTEQFRAGKKINSQVNEAVKAGQLGKNDVADIAKGGSMTPFAEHVRALKGFAGLNAAIDVYKLANDTEQNSVFTVTDKDGTVRMTNLYGYLWKKVGDTLPGLSPNEQKDIMQRLKTEVSKPTKTTKPVGVSRAQELGVPMPIPQRQPNEDDIGYRARLLQVGRARSAKLDEVASAGDFGAMDKASQRKALYNGVFS